MSQPMVSVRVYVFVYATLMILLALTVGAAYVHLGNFNILVALTISVAKALLIISYFMHMRYSARTKWAFAGVGFLWLAILLALTMTDYLTRSWLPLPVGWEPSSI